jgi:8-oxo-dGTP diphosphatase
MQLSYCYIARAGKRQHTMLSESEELLGMAVEWMTLDKALEVMNDSFLICDDYSTRFMILRDKTILAKTVNILTEK